jgi:hypothetical protein
MIAQGDPAKLASETARRPTALGRRHCAGARGLGLVQDCAVLLVGGRAHLCHVGMVVAARVGSGVPNAGCPVVFRNVSGKPLQVLEVPGGVRERHEPITELEGTEAPDRSPDG